MSAYCRHAHQHSLFSSFKKRAHPTGYLLATTKAALAEHHTSIILSLRGFTLLPRPPLSSGLVLLFSRRSSSSSGTGNLLLRPSSSLLLPIRHRLLLLLLIHRSLGPSPRFLLYFPFCVISSLALRTRFFGFGFVLWISIGYFLVVFFRFFFLGGIVAALVVGVGGVFLVHLKLGLVFHHVIAGTRECDCGIIGLGGFLDGVAAFGLHGDFAFLFFLGNFAAWLRAVPIPRG